MNENTEQTNPRQEEPSEKPAHSAAAAQPADQPGKAKIIGQGFRLGLAAGLLVALLLAFLSPQLREFGFVLLTLKYHEPKAQELNLALLQKQQTLLEKEIVQLRRRNERLEPATPFLIISSSDNKFTLVERRKPIRSGVCSTGSNVLLKTEDDRRWMFRTPTGVLRVLNKMRSPIWIKPDWAFIEEGLPVPPPGADERFDYGALGEYGLALGQGYLIHGTLYQRMLGMPVTHGCIRLGDEDLAAVYHKLDIGSRVYIY